MTDLAALARRLDKMLATHADAMPKEAYFEVDAVMRALKAPPAQPVADAEEDAYVIERMGKLLAEIAIIVNGTEPHDTLWSYHDLPEKVRALKQAPPAAVVPPLMDFLLWADGWRETDEHDELTGADAVAYRVAVTIHREMLAAHKENNND